MGNHKVITIDLHFQNLPGAIAAYLVPHREGAVLVESGPGSTLPALQSALQAHGYTPRDITHVLLTHIHLDHAGAAGWLARQGARILVHPNGASHLINPEKLLASAQRIWGDWLDPLWGEFLAVPEQKLTVVEDSDQIEVGELCFRAIDTPGHASHHHAYRLDDLLFIGDVGGVRLAGKPALRLPMPPPEFHLENWRMSLKRLRQEYNRGGLERIAPTHFGIYPDPGWHLSRAAAALDEIEAWIRQILPSDPPLEALRQAFETWNAANLRGQGLDDLALSAQEAVNPAYMSADGIQRYWKKYKNRKERG